MEKTTLVLFPSCSQKVRFLIKALCPLGGGKLLYLNVIMTSVVLFGFFRVVRSSLRNYIVLGL